MAKFALLDPAAEISSLEQVFIITKYTTEIEGAADATGETLPNGETVPATTPDGNVG